MLHGEGIYFVKRIEEGPVVAFHNLATGQEHVVASVPQLASPSLAVSPDGQSLLYGRIERSESDLLMVPLAP